MRCVRMYVCARITGDCDGYEFECDDGSCVEASLECDGHDDCKDRSDEDNCTTGTYISHQRLIIL